MELQILEASLNFILKLITSLILLKIIVANIYRYFLESTAFHYLSLFPERRTFHILVGLCYFAGYKCSSFWPPNSIYLRFLFINFLYSTVIFQNISITICSRSLFIVIWAHFTASFALFCVTHLNLQAVDKNLNL